MATGNLGIKGIGLDLVNLTVGGPDSVRATPIRKNRSLIIFDR